MPRRAAGSVVAAADPASSVPCGSGRSGTLRHRVAVTAVAAILVVAGCGNGDGDGPGSAGGAAAVLDADQIELGGSLWGAAVDDGIVWVSDPTRATVVAVDGRGERQREVPTGAPDPRDAGIAVADGRLWVANLGGSVGVVDLSTGAPLGRVSVGPGEPATVVVDGRWAWAPRHGPGGGLTRIDAVDLSRPGVPVDLPAEGFAAALDGETVWVTGLDAGLFAVDRDRAAVRLEVDLPGAPRGVAIAAGDVWVSLRDRGEVARVDASTGEVIDRIEVGGQPWPVTAGAGAVWAATLDGRLVRIDPATARVTASATVGAQPRAIAVGADAVWVTSQMGSLSRVELG